MFDIVIRNGKIVDGTGNPWFPGDVGIEGERITAIGDLSQAEAKVAIDAAGKIVCPGFVDCHAHSERTILANREATSSIYQGVTTEIAGNCGMGFAPITDLSRTSMEKFVAFFTPGVPVDWAGFGEWLDRIADGGVAINIGLQVGHHAIRRAVMGMDDRAPTEEEMRAMQRLVAESLDAGAIGLSFGLEFMPGRVADSEELRRLCVEAAERGCMTSWHVRNRDRKFSEAVAESIDVTRAAGAALQLSHLSAKPGSSPRAWNQVMELVYLARAQGQDVQCDMIPYVAGPGRLSTILPTWATQGTTAEVQARLRDPRTRELLIAESDRYWLLFYYREWDKLTLMASRSHPEWVGMTFREIGEAAGQDPFQCVYDILADEGDSMDETKINGVLFSEGDIVEWLSDPLFSIAADGFTTTDGAPFTDFSNHPNCYGWTPTVIQKYVRELRSLRLEEAIRKMTSMPAERFGLTQRGILRAGMLADVIVFDDATFQTRSTYLKPHVYAEGMDFVIVNGQLALEDGVPTGALAGRVLRG
jgi:N-acyl-D-amino-acid deacylase